MPPRSLPLGLLSAAAIAHQIFLIQILSYIQWHHFAFMIISMALLGFGVSGTVLSLFRDHLAEKEGYYFPLFISLFALSVPVCHDLSVCLHFDPYVSLWQFGKLHTLIGFYILTFLPFFFAALAIGLVFSCHPSEIGFLYFSNLFGSGIGGVMGLIALHCVAPKSLPAVSAWMGIAAFLTAAWHRQATRTRLQIFLIFLAAAFTVSFPDLSMSEYKSLSKSLLLPDAEVVTRRGSPYGYLEVVRSAALRYAPGLSLSYGGTIPSRLGIFSNGEWVGAIAEGDEYLSHTSAAAPYRMTDAPDTFIVGAATGGAVALALREGAKSVHGVELNPQLLELITGFSDGQADRIFNDPRIFTEAGEARNVLSRSARAYDLISIPVMEGFAVGAAGLSALQENYLFTVESFVLMLDRLTARGMISVSGWLRNPPRSSLRLLTTAYAALKRRGADQPENHIALIISWSGVTMLVSENVFSAAQADRLTRFCEQLSFDLIRGPSETDAKPIHKTGHIWFQKAFDALGKGDARKFIAEYPFDITPATDDRPFFGHFFKFATIGWIRETYGMKMLPFAEWGFLILLATLAQIVVIAFVMILIPLFRLGKTGAGRGIKAKVFLYFAALGLGYMGVEMVLLQKLVLYLGSPVYSASAAITGMLVFSGFGSLISSRLQIRFKVPARWMTALVAVLILGYFYVFLPVLYEIPVYSNSYRYVTSIIWIGPLSFLMGMPFPLGLSSLEKKGMDRLIPWAWGINGFFSVAATGAATLIAVHSGFHRTVAVAAFCYLAASVAADFRPGIRR
ncbi:hypothetical protein DENIS_0720 [Desulfonema ishimotonii]|uniref:Spermidine synthase-like protein n=1 Tax=Desulfonema ishimotonii TaxID=45657 RepID=A0A401FS33_9BACT|nr:hypothetical protein [Desulfonema ishimotonii]GBC59779.1 hypothetical protein DENIS_0720 [Desulfonema ishimotonii]